MKPTVAVFGTLRFPPEKLQEVRSPLRQLIEATNKHDGCLLYQAAEDPFDPGLIRFSELWPDSAALDRHLKATHIEPWRTAARSLGLIERKFTAYSIAGSWDV